ncbi:MAG: glycosyltransferase family 2 protein [Chloroflexi bacterium]|nr:glycosyltransferase family 2 protein [Chloroflexota bacterium]
MAQLAKEVPYLSIVVPLFNEQDSLELLHNGLTRALRPYTYEILFVDDGSFDRSLKVLQAIQLHDHHARVIRFSRNFGKAEALTAGFRESRGQVVVTLDADLQDDPQEIPRLLAGLEEGYDLVSGWKIHRKDPLSKTLPSRLFNRATSSVTGLHLHDFNSGLKAYRRPVIKKVQVYGEQHRFIPALAHWQGFRVTEIPVNHYPRLYGHSKFGMRRFLSGLLDLLTVLFLTRFSRKPLHLFGSAGLIALSAGMILGVYLSILWFAGDRPIGNRPLLMLAVLLIVMGVQFITLGLLGEMLTLSAAREGKNIHHYDVFDSTALPLSADAEPSPEPHMGARPRP